MLAVLIEENMDTDNYTEYYALIDGALAESVYANDGTIACGVDAYTDEEFAGQPVEAWLDDLETGAVYHGFHVEVFTIEHYHSPFIDEPCECSQYLTDHHPAYTFGIDSEDGD